MAWGERATRTITVTHGEDTATVTVQELLEGDRQDMFDVMNGAGSARAFILERGIVSWTIPLDLTAESIALLPQEVGSTIFEAITTLSEGIEGENPPT